MNSNRYLPSTTARWGARSNSGEFTKAAIETATRQGVVQLIDGEELRALIGPIPEPEASPFDLRSAAGSIASHVGDRLLTAAEELIRGGRRTEPRVVWRNLPGRDSRTKGTEVINSPRSGKADRDHLRLKRGCSLSPFAVQSELKIFDSKFCW
jgi:hypothetical protein